MTKEDAVRVGRDKIIEMLGRDYVMEHKDFCLLWYEHEGDKKRGQTIINLR